MNARPQTSDVWAPATGLRYPTPRSAQFVSADDFLRLALQAHLAACRGMVPPAGERWIDPEFDLLWSSPEDFMRGLLHHLGERLRRHAIKTRHLAEVPWSAEEIAEDAAFQAEMQRWLDGLDARLSGASNGANPGAGAEPLRSGAKDGPASSPAVGPAPGVSHDRNITLNGDPLFCASGVQELPVGETLPHTRYATEKSP